VKVPIVLSHLQLIIVDFLLVIVYSPARVVDGSCFVLSCTDLEPPAGLRGPSADRF
jgi:hypothetical protein